MFTGTVYCGHCGHAVMCWCSLFLLDPFCITNQLLTSFQFTTALQSWTRCPFSEGRFQGTTFAFCHINLLFTSPHSSYLLVTLGDKALHRDFVMCHCNDCCAVSSLGGGCDSTGGSRGSEDVGADHRKVFCGVVWEVCRLALVPGHQNTRGSCGRCHTGMNSIKSFGWDDLI